MAADPLKVRLFGYGVPYRVHFAADGAVLPLPTDPLAEAADLARALRAHLGIVAPAAVPPAAGPQWARDLWCLSMPLGRSGLGGLPHEHLKVHGFAEAWMDVLDAQGQHSWPLAPGETVRVIPGRVVRVRARPHPPGRVLVAFQTEDRTPLAGNAAPFTLDGCVPAGYDERLRTCHAAFDCARRLAGSDPAAFQEVLEAFFGRMRAQLAADPQIAATQAAARQEGTYGLEDQEPLFARQQEMLTPERLERLERADPELFRFPGMFGGIATLFTQVR
ncbi:MAG: hypothetical protein AB1505_07110 [Candidatus Latescibacterota bacterium]